MTDIDTQVEANHAPAQPVHSSEYRQFLRAHRRTTTLVLTAQIGVLVILVGVWHVGANVNWWDPLLTSTPSEVLRTGIDLASDGSLWRNSWTTLVETIVSAVVGYLGGIGIAVAIWWSRFLGRLLDPYLVIANAMPKVALAPIFYIFLGQSLSIYGMAISISIIVTIIMAYTSFVGTDSERIKLLRTFGGTKWQILTKVVLPGSVADLVAAAKVGVGLTLVGVIVGEFVAAKAGLGYQILYGSQIFNMSIVVVGIVMLIVISAGLYGLVSLVEKRVVRNVQ